MDTIRSFIALDIPIKDDLNKVWNSIVKEYRNDKIKWVEPEILHLTLFFLGDIDHSLIEPIKIKLIKGLSGIKGFDIVLKGLGVFGGKNNPKVIWVGVEPSETLVQLFNIIVETLFLFGFTPDERGFKPHITLGRVKHVMNPIDLITTINKHRNAIFQANKVNSVVFYKSELTPRGPIYTALFKHNLV